MGVRIGELLLQEQRITPEQLQEALNQQKAQGGRLGYNLVKLGYVRDEEIAAPERTEDKQPASASPSLAGVSSQEARLRKEQKMRTRNQEGFTLIELLIVVAIIGIIAGIAVPGLLQARMTANEASAIGSARAVNSAQSSYSINCAQGFAPTMAELATSPATGGQPFISPDLNASPVTKSGYIMTYTPGTAIAGAAGSCTGTPGPVPVDIYAFAAAPVSAGSSGVHYFGTNEQQTIYQDTAAVTFGAAPTRTPSGAAVPIK